MDEKVRSRNTRDIAIEGFSMISQHMTDCTKFREGLSDTLKEFRADIKTLYIRLAVILGVLMTLKEVAVWGVQHIQK